MISLLCPTRGRPKEAERLLKSFQKTQKNENEILFYVQNDDKFKEQVTKYKKNDTQLLDAWFNIHEKIFGRKVPTYLLSLIYWLKKTKYDKSNYINFINDSTSSCRY